MRGIWARLRTKHRAGRRAPAAQGFILKRVPRSFAPRAVRSLLLRYEAAAVALVLALGAAVAVGTTRVAQWFVMTDELLYERLAISVAQTGSLLPRVHGEVVPNLNQLYPLLLAPLFGERDVGGSLHDAHLLNSFVMASAAVPVFLLARCVLRRPLVSLAVAALAVTVPWIVLSSFLLTEVVAYPAFSWALLAITYSVLKKRAGYDLLALLAIVVAVGARTQFLLLFVVLPLAVLVEAALAEAESGARRTGVARSAARTLLRTRRPLLSLYALGLALVVGLAAAGEGSTLLGSYSTTARGTGDVSLSLFRLAAEHLAVIGLTFAVLPFLVAVAWLLARLRPSATPHERAFAVVSVIAIVLLTLEVASFDDRFGGGLVKDRYLFYVAPLILVGLAGAVVGPWPRWSLAIPAAVSAAGFASTPFPVYEKLNVDSPSAIVNNRLLEIATSARWAHVALAIAAPVLAMLFVQATALLPRRPLAVLLALAALVLPAQAAYAFDRLFSVIGTAGLPITQDQRSVFTWIDTGVPPGSRVTIVPYPFMPGDYWAGVSFWWNLEFWNESIESSARVDGSFSYTPSTFPKLDLRFDPETGLASRTGGEYIAISVFDSRFAPSGSQAALSFDTRVVAAARPWQARWVSYGLYEDGWTRTGQPATLRVFAEPGQVGAVERSVSLTLWPAPGAVGKPVTATSSSGRWDGVVEEGGVSGQVPVCVPARGYADVRVWTPAASPIEGGVRTVGVMLRQIALSDESSSVDRCP